MRTPTTPITAALCLLAGLGLALPASAQAPSTPSRPHTAALGGARIWWNQPRFIETLGLTPEQRGAMDASLDRHLETRRTEGADYRNARLSFADAVSRGDWNAATAAQGRMAELAGQLSKTESDLILAVLRHLTASQRQTLNREFPLLLRRPWVRGGARERTSSDEPH